MVIRHLLLLLIILPSLAQPVLAQNNTLPPLKDNQPPQTLDQLWHGFDPRAEPLETEILHEWEEDNVVLRIVRFRIGIFKGEKAMLAGIYGYPKGRKNLPGLVQIHGGGQYADHKACLMNAKNGYATISIAWAGRISAPNYRVGPDEVKLFWEQQTDHPKYKVTTDWGAVDAYHAPSRNKGNNYPSAKPASWTIDPVESPRNSPWFLSTIAARRALTFIEQQPEVNPDKLGVYGHSMGGKLTVMTSIDPRVKAAAPSCGGISDRDNDSMIFRATIGDNNSLKLIKCPIIFLSPANDFHGRIGDLPTTINEIQSDQWRVTCSPHRSHQDTGEYEVATLLWFNQHLKNEFQFPKSPELTVDLQHPSGPSVIIKPDQSKKILAIDVYYTQHGKTKETRFDRLNTKNRFWRHASTSPTNRTKWSAKLNPRDPDKPLWVYANVTYALNKPLSGAGYYYGIYTADTFVLSTLLKKISPNELQTAGLKPNSQRSLIIEDFKTGWEKQWYTTNPADWARATHKVYDEQWHAPDNARLSIEVKSDRKNQFIIRIDSYAAVINLNQPNQWQQITLSPSDFTDADDRPMESWNNIKDLKLTHRERLRSAIRGSSHSKTVGKPWQGPPPQFRKLRWIPQSDPSPQ